MVAFFSKWITPNQLTVIRVLLIPVIFFFIWKDTPIYLIIAGGLFTLACMTDYWDGVLARFEGKSTKLGQLLDPVADKILITTVLVILTAQGRVLALITALLIAREFTISGLRSIATLDGIVIPASRMGKLKTSTQMIAIGFLIVHYKTLGIPCHEIGTGLLWLATVVSIWSGVEYFMAFYNSISDELELFSDPN